MPTIRRACALTALILSLIPVAALASTRRRAKPRPLATVVLHLRWHAVADHTLGIVASERYVAFVPRASGPAGLTLLDTRTGRKTRLHGGCRRFDVVEFGGPYLAYTCAAADPQSPGEQEEVHLLNLSRGVWSTVTPSSDLAGSLCQHHNCALGPVGAYWVEFGTQSYWGCSEHCFPAYTPQNLATGKVPSRVPFGAGRSYVDSNAPSVVGTLCSPLRTLANFDEMWPDPPVQRPWLLRLGSFVVGVDDSAGTLGADPHTSYYYLGRCHSRLRLGLSGAFAVSNEVVAWESGGVFLPSLRGFTFKMPRVLSYASPYPASAFPFPANGRSSTNALAASGRELFVVTGATGRVWEAKLPSRY